MPNTAPPIFATKVPTADEWKAYFAAKTDGTGGTLADGTITGGTITDAEISGGSIAGNVVDASIRSLAGPATQRAPTIADNSARGCKVSDTWFDPTSRIMWEARSVTGQASWIPLAGLPDYPMAGQPAAAVLYGTIKCHPDWTGDSLTITRDAGSPSTLDVPLIFRAPWAGKIVDQAAADAFCAGTVGRITKVFDQTGGGNHATALTSHAPIWDSTKQINGIPVISFQSVKHDFASEGGPAAVNHYLVIPSGVTWNPADCTWLMVYAHNNPGTAADPGGLLTNAAGTFGWAQTYNDGQGLRGVGLQGTADTHLTTTPSVLCVSGGASFWRMWNGNDYESVGHPTTTTAGAGGNIGWSSSAGGSIFSMVAFALWTSQLFTSQVRPPLVRNFEKACGIQNQFDHLIIVAGASGDSGTASTTGSSWPFELARALPPSCRIINNSSHGHTLTALWDRRVQMLGNPYTRHRGATAATVVFVITPAGNDIAQGASLETLKANTQALVAYCKGLGSNVRVVLSLKFMQQRFIGDAVKTAALQGYNEWVASSYNVPIEQGGCGADDHADQFNAPLISNATYTSPVKINSGLVSPDSLHLYSDGQSTVMMLYAAPIRRVLRAA